jgi:hypothetical protein
MINWMSDNEPDPATELLDYEIGRVDKALLDEPRRPVPPPLQQLARKGRGWREHREITE